MSSKLKPFPVDFAKWFDRISRSRIENCGESVADYPFASCRLRIIGGKNEYQILQEDMCNVTSERISKGSVVYWMNRDQRVQDNWAFLFAQRVAMKFSAPLHVCFELSSSPALKTQRHTEFALQGLMELEKECAELDIGFHLIYPGIRLSKASIKRKVDGETVPKASGKSQPIIDLCKRLDARVLVTDFSPLRDQVQLVQRVANLLPQDVPLYQVDAHNVVPVWYASKNMEYGARTIRPKLHECAKQLFTDFPPLVAHPVPTKSDATDWMAVFEWAAERADRTVGAVQWAQGGASAGFAQLFSFLHNRLHAYAKDRNDPTKHALSNLSPWFHFGHISTQRCLWEVKLLRNSHKESVDAFIEESFIRRELAENFCFYNANYDSLKGAWAWAQETLRKHSKDVRMPSYSERDMESASTEDELWNAAQRQLVRDGKLHGFLRMYWAKKILEWHPGGPEGALNFAFRLNDRYSLDGTDPNGYVGVMWSICGIHDQGWQERPIFGKIRFMNFNGCKRKFDVEAFIKKYPKYIKQ